MTDDEKCGWLSENAWHCASLSMCFRPAYSPERLWRTSQRSRYSWNQNCWPADACRSPFWGFFMEYLQFLFQSSKLEPINHKHQTQRMILLLPNLSRTLLSIPQKQIQFWLSPTTLFSRKWRPQTFQWGETSKWINFWLILIPSSTISTKTRPLTTLGRRTSV